MGVAKRKFDLKEVVEKLVEGDLGTYYLTISEDYENLCYELFPHISKSQRIKYLHKKLNA